MESTSGPSGFDDVRLRLRALPESLPVARTLAAAVASQWGFTLDIVDDARLVVSELLTLVLQSHPGAEASITFAHDPSTLRVSVQTDATVPPPTTESFGWLVVSELARDLKVRSDETGLSITASLTTEESAG